MVQCTNHIYLYVQQACPAPYLQESHVLRGIPGDVELIRGSTVINKDTAPEGGMSVPEPAQLQQCLQSM
jgi:hypothetical protein